MGKATAIDGWCILRTSGGRTLALAASLDEAGLEAWTPTVAVKRRLPRKQQRVERPAPMMPTFVFAKAADLPELARHSRSPVNPHPSFSVFRFDGRIPILHDREIEQLRLAEGRAVPRRRRATIAAGAKVRPTEGAYAGMDGVVRDSDGRFTLVAFGGWMSVRIETLLLLGDQVGEDQPAMAAAA